MTDLGSDYGLQELTRASVLLRQLAPRDSPIWQLTDKYVRRSIPNWHWSMLHDVRRNKSYETAIGNLISADSIVLEIGCGSGLLSMMAARAGAEHVYTCESNPELARVARENIERSGLAAKITVINKPAEDLRLGRDLPARCNVLLHEMISGDLVGEGLLNVVESVSFDLLEDGALHLPDRIYAKIQGVRNAPLLNGHRAPETDGMELSAIDILSPAVSPVYPFPEVAVVGLARTMIEFAGVGNRFSRTDFKPVPLSEFFVQGMVGLIQWIGFSFPDGTSYENGPGSASHWEWRFHPLSRYAEADRRKAVMCDVIDDQLLIYIDHWPESDTERGALLETLELS